MQFSYNHPMRQFFTELRRRNVFKVAALYIVVAWLILQVTDVFMGILPLPEWTSHLIFLLLVIGFPLALIFAWAFEVTPEGIKREKEVDRERSITPMTGRKLDFWIIGVLAVALAYFAWEHDWSGEDEDLEAPPPVAETGGLKTIAVLPFVNISEDENNTYFSDGISEEILNVLVKVDGLRVTSRTSSFAFKDSDAGLPTIAQALKVDNVLEGSVRKSGNRVRITAQLIDVPSDSHLWSETYERELEDIFVIQKDISHSIVEALEATLGTATAAIADEQVRLTDNVEAYEAYLQGKYRLHNRGALGAEGLEEAKALFQQAIDGDPEFAEAWAGLGAVHVLYPGYANANREDSDPHAEAALNRAIELDPNSGEAYAALGLLRIHQWRWREADRTFATALRVDPDHEDIYVWYGILLTCVGKTQRARDVLLTAADKDPMSGIGAHWLADIYRNLGDMERSYTEAARSVELGTVTSVMGVYLYHLHKEQWDEATAALNRFGASLGIDSPWPELLLEATIDPQAIPAYDAQIRRILEDHPSFYYGWMYFDLDDTELLLDVIEEYTARGNTISMMYRVWEPQLTALRNHPRFKALMQEVGLIDYWRETGWPDLCRQSTDELVCD